jgi:two-component system cell cycle sensor histidine kinase/response regulator CckA
MSWTLVILLLLAAGSTVAATFAYLSTYRRLKRLEADLPDGWARGAGPAGAILDPAGVLAEAPFGLYAADRTGRVLYVNRRLAHWLAAEPEALGGVARLDEWLAEPLPVGAAGDGAAADVEGEGGAVARAVAHSAATVGRVRLRDRTGTAFPAWIAQDVAREEDGSERIYGVVRRLPDTDAEIDEQSGETAAAPEAPSGAEAPAGSAGRFERFFEVAPVGIVVTDGSGALRDYNAAALALAGLDPPEPSSGAPELRLTDLVDERDRESLEEALAGGWDTPIEVRMAGGAGRVCALHLTRLAPGDGAGEIVAHFIDTTEQKSLEVQFAQSQKMQAIGQLAGGVAHDFNNLLTAMIGFSDLLLLRHRPGDQSFADIMHIQQNAKRAAGLVRQLLAFSRQQTLQPKVLDVTDILAELSSMLRRLIGETIELKMVHGRDLGQVKADQGQLEQVIINLAVNARDAMPEGGTLTIETDSVAISRPMKRKGEIIPAGDYTRIRVSDTGCGIAQEDLDRIFEPFYSTKEVGAGTGLGLSTVYGIVSQTGGFVEVKSQLGQGTSFAIYLPQHRADEEAVESAQAKAEASRDLTGMGTVLLVEDEDAVRAFGARALMNKGYKVLEANSGEAALEVLNDGGEAVDLLITDVVMPRLDGPSLVRKVRETRPDMPVIFISGYAEDSFRQRLGREAGIHFLPKPFSLKDLAGKVKEVMGDKAA